MSTPIIPKISNPLAKDIRTGEGILEYVIAAVLGLAAILPHGLTWTQTGTYATILAGVKGFRRLLLKAIALQKGVGIADPIVDPDLLARLQALENSRFNYAETGFKLADPLGNTFAASGGGFTNIQADFTKPMTVPDTFEDPTVIGDMDSETPENDPAPSGEIGATGVKQIWHEPTGPPGSEGFDPGSGPTGPA